MVGWMDGWTGGSVWTDGHCIGRRRVASVGTKSECIQRAARDSSLSLPLFPFNGGSDERTNPPTCAFLLPHLPFHTALAFSPRVVVPSSSHSRLLLSRGGRVYLCRVLGVFAKARFSRRGCWKSRLIDDSAGTITRAVCSVSDGGERRRPDERRISPRDGGFSRCRRVMFVRKNTRFRRDSCLLFRVCR